MINRLTNAGVLDGVDGWAATAGMALAKDETVRGAPGRGVFRASGISGGAGQSFAVTTASTGRADVQGSSVVEVSVATAAFVAGSAVPPYARLVFFDAGGSVLMAHELNVRRPALASWGVARDGLLDTYYRAWARIERPASAVSAAVEAGGQATGSGQAIEAVMLKPLIAEAPQGSQHPLLWSPGQHSSVDLKRPSWPGAIRDFGVGASFEPKPGLIEFDAGPGRPMSRPITADAARKLSGQIRCDVVQRALLEAFHATARSFWIVEPGSERLCVGSWAADGAPRLSETRGGLHVMDVALWLETA
ncbi:hypothetical protein [Brevundimonas naejangsanensis]|uniref:hypothetical protein n=1 Tax=Brevundimonas naejangsanensis TaxID=588932 RepID=UPI0026EA7621|nr:hypothetical protein [Brevundimonas naejangsanensis]